jgi:hypothetical protein
VALQTSSLEAKTIKSALTHRCIHMSLLELHKSGIAEDEKIASFTSTRLPDSFSHEIFSTRASFTASREAEIEISV